MEPLKKLVKQAATQVDRERDRFAATLGITGVQMSIIDFLSNQKNHTAGQKAIEDEFAIQRSTTSIIINRMVRHQLVRRIPDPSDKRRKKVQLSEKSLALTKPIKQHMCQEDLGLRKNLSPKEEVIIKRFLQKIIQGGAAGHD